MAEANYDQAFLYDDDDFDEKEFVQELLKSGIYCEQTNLDGILEAAQKNRDATIDRVKKLNIVFGSEQNEDENQVVPDSEKPTEKSEFNIDNDNHLQNATPGSTGLDVSSTLEKLPLKETADEPEPVANFPSPEVLIILDEPLQNGEEKKAEAQTRSLIKVDLKAAHEVLLTLEEPLQTCGEAEAETLSPGKVDLKATLKVPAPLDEPHQTGGETEAKTENLSLVNIDLKTSPEVLLAYTGEETKAKAMTSSLVKVDLKATPEVLLTPHKSPQISGEAEESLSLGEVGLRTTREVFSTLHEPHQTGGGREAKAETLSLGKVDPTPEVFLTLDERFQNGEKTEAEADTLPLDNVDVKTTPEVLMTQTGGETKAKAKTSSLVKIDLKATPEVLLTLHEPLQTGGEAEAETLSLGEIDLKATPEVLRTLYEPLQTGRKTKTDAETLSLSEIDLKITPEVFVTLQEPHYTDGEAQTAAETALLSEVDLEATTEVVLLRKEPAQNDGGRKPKIEPQTSSLMNVDLKADQAKPDIPICLSSSSKRACSEWQTTGDVHSSGAEAPSTRALTAGCPHECDEPRSGCLDIKSVMSSDQTRHIPSSSINEDGSIAGKREFVECQSHLDDHEALSDDTHQLSKNKDKQQHNDCQPNKKNKGKKTKAQKNKETKADKKATKVDAKKTKADTKKTTQDTKKTKVATKKIKADTKKTKVDAKGKRLDDKKAKETKSKKFYRRLISLFCCCVLSQEKNEELNEKHLEDPKFISKY